MTTRQLRRACEQAGFDVRNGKGDHLVLYVEGRRVGTLAGSPSDPRSFLNTVSDIRRAGYPTHAARLKRAAGRG